MIVPGPPSIRAARWAATAPSGSPPALAARSSVSRRWVRTPERTASRSTSGAAVNTRNAVTASMATTSTSVDA